MGGVEECVEGLNECAELVLSYGIRGTRNLHQQFPGLCQADGVVYREIQGTTVTLPARHSVQV